MPGIMAAWPPQPPPGGDSDADDRGDDGTGRPCDCGHATVTAHVLARLRATQRHLPAPPPADTAPAAPGGQRRFWRDTAGRFRRRPDPGPAPGCDDILSLADAAAAAGPATGGPVPRPSPQPSPRPASRAETPRAETPFARTVTFPAPVVPCPHPARWRSAWRRANGR